LWVSELLSSKIDALIFRFFFIDDSSGFGHVQSCLDMVSRDHPDVDLVLASLLFILVLTLLLAVPDELHRLADVGSQRILQTEGAEINQVRFQLVSKLIGFNVDLGHPAGEGGFVDLLVGV
jgi:hypothetical protein